jgi:protoheme IX farnesyltransferase
LSRAAVDILPPALPAPRWLARPGLYLELSKAKLSALVVFTAAAGWLMAPATPRIEAHDPARWAALAGVLAGVALAAFGANSLNQVLEAGRDALMRRTRRRPLPARRIGRGEAVAWGLIASAAGLFLLAVFGNMLTAGLGLANILIYLLIYTPLKPRTPANTLVGAVVGALPPMMGWTAATGSVGTGACVLGAILFIWQVPHFLALAWSNRADYAAGGFRMLPSVDPSGRITGALVLVHCLALPPITLALTLTGLTDGFYAAGALVLGLWLAWLGLQLRRRCDQENARRVFLASVMYLPLLLVMMTADRLLRGAMPVH